MNNPTISGSPADKSPAGKSRAARHADDLNLRNRHRTERIFRRMGTVAVWIGLVFLGVLFFTILYSGLSAFKQTVIKIDISIIAPEAAAQQPANTASLVEIDYESLVKQALRKAFPEAGTRRERCALYNLLSPGAAFELRQHVLDHPDLVGRTNSQTMSQVRSQVRSQTISLWLTASDNVDMMVKGAVARDAEPGDRRISNQQLAWITSLEEAGRLKTQFNLAFFTNGDSREPELAGIAVAAVGSFLSLLVCLALSFPLGVMTAIYMEEFAPRSRWSEFVEVNINNLAAVPSIVFGLLGLAVFLNVFNLPRSAPLVGGMVLALMTLPTIIITGRAALKAVPPSIRDAALAVGASPLQAVFHHILPLAMPGVLTGTIIGTARALGETAPLLMIGMVAFVVDIPESILSPATALPVQVFLWADSPERAFEERTAAAILVLLGFVFLMNFLAVMLRRKFEVRW